HQLGCRRLVVAFTASPRFCASSAALCGALLSIPWRATPAIPAPCAHSLARNPFTTSTTSTTSTTALLPRSAGSDGLLPRPRPGSKHTATATATATDTDTPSAALLGHCLVY
ncbi:hypothetical protein BDV95DRAFT_674136, partial [Massariosphaeria phaeospora]